MFFNQSLILIERINLYEYNLMRFIRFLLFKCEGDIVVDCQKINKL